MAEQLLFSLGQAHFYPPEETVRAVVFLPSEAEQTAEILRKLEPGIALIALDHTDWNRDFSPWAAPAVFGREDFSGGGMAFLRALLDEVVPAAAQRWPGVPMVLAGYSLAGLFAVWAAMQTDVFAGVASMSGSLWFDGFVAYAQQTPLLAAWAYLSVGNREKRTRNLRMQRVEDACREVCTILQAQAVETVFELNEGNHFQQVPERIARGVNWVCARL